MRTCDEGQKGSDDKIFCNANPIFTQTHLLDIFRVEDVGFVFHQAWHAVAVFGKDTIEELCAVGVVLVKEFLQDSTEVIVPRVRILRVLDPKVRQALEDLQQIPEVVWGGE